MIAVPGIIFNSDTPAASDGCYNIIFQTDGADPQQSISAFDPLMIGDAGSGGFAGNVPAPAAGDAAAGKFLAADGTWDVPPAPPSGFTNGNNSNGYWVKDPVGHITQWGKITTDINGGTLFVSFPTAFTDSSSIAVQVTTRAAVDRITFEINGSVGTSGFQVSNNGSGGYADWRADGY
jgi:hypothetical protein